MLEKFFSWHGRINRAKYWGYHFLVGIVSSTLSHGIAYLMDNSIGTVLYYIIAIGSFYPMMCIIVKRLHDVDKSGYLAFLCLIPIVNLYPAILCAFIKGTDGPNRFGPDPLELNEIDEDYVKETI
ncbi:DUF805 domain-containing protein [Anaeromicrobium sediminis]|uniref:DUF805 domain-containing protein n=1 Tax=Anaeromicrobium sediminis TaxID=1478221 RepID=A0A267MPC4_9FIRM|nr:DUF805 domain-containing protein [Anaeromicrobium sediminis]PAB61297.1 hypothetical protein CCE28_02375 [Anaeromicrobium sediminis]